METVLMGEVSEEYLRRPQKDQFNRKKKVYQTSTIYAKLFLRRETFKPIRCALIRAHFSA